MVRPRRLCPWRVIEATIWIGLVRSLRIVQNPIRIMEYELFPLEVNTKGFLGT